MKETVTITINGSRVEEHVFDTVLLSLPEEAFILFKNIEEYIFERKLLELVSSNRGKTEVSVTSEDINIEEFADLFPMKKSTGNSENLKEIVNTSEEKGTEIIYENAVFAGIITGITTKAEVLQIMRKYSSFEFKAVNKRKSYYYEDIGVIVYFEDNEIVKELTFDQNFKGQTSKGLKIGDSIEKAVNLYGQPVMRSATGAIWPKIAVFVNAEIITSIRIQK